MVKIVDAGLKFRYELDPPPTNVRKIVQHHMAHPSWDIYDVHNFHKNSNGWNGIGYNYWIAFDGTIYKGRGLHYGAGVGGHNHYTLHIGYQGDFTKQNMTDAQVKSGAELNKWLLGKYNLSANDIIGHGELASSACPGKNFRMSDLRKAVSNGTVISVPTKIASMSTKSTSGSLGLVDYMNSKGMDSSYSNRKKLATQYGISGYKGTASQNTKLLAKIKGVKPSNTSKHTASIQVDGYMGKLTIKAMQRYFGTPIDGVLSKPSSLVIKKLQKLLGVTQDGIMGRNTISAMQRRFGTVVDGKLSSPSLVIKELQRRLNKGEL